MTTIPQIAAVCSGNICRSVMAEYVWRKHIRSVEFSSAGVMPLDPGGPADPVTVRILERRNYGPVPHRVRGVSIETLSCDLIVVAQPPMAELLVGLGAPAGAVRSMCSLDPRSSPLDEVANPWGEPLGCYEAVLGLLERCVPALQEWAEARA